MNKYIVKRPAKTAEQYKSDHNNTETPYQIKVSDTVGFYAEHPSSTILLMISGCIKSIMTSPIINRAAMMAKCKYRLIYFHICITLSNGALHGVRLHDDRDEHVLRIYRRNGAASRD